MTISPAISNSPHSPKICKALKANDRTEEEEMVIKNKEKGERNI